ncbi:NAD(P)-dependent oxidoreductase [Microvirga pakistanensis]|uniref:NAD(P)-dependent oxidoreductase n=1 Tax=Microvirga pakistanensis TaxID=1682650 RepID=UPI00195C2D0B|nr:NAD(P)-dependent oxidoreductase [Microvirga pakistanensis]
MTAPGFADGLPASQAAMNVGFVGLGRMGLALARNLAASGVRMTVLDAVAERAAMVHGGNVSKAESLGSLAANSDVIFLMLPGPREVRSVALGSDGIFAAARPGTIIIDLSTVDVDTVDLLAEQAGLYGLYFGDAPVGRLAAHADRGESLFMVGAETQVLERISPLLAAMGTTILHCGPAGHGTRTKLVNNFMVLSYCQINSEALTLATALGLELDRTLEVLLGTTASNGQLRDKWRAKVLAGDLTPGFALTLGLKDLTLACDAAASSRVALPMGNTARDIFRLAASAGYGDSDTSSLTDFWAKANNLQPLRCQTDKST